MKHPRLPGSEKFKFAVPASSQEGSKQRQSFSTPDGFQSPSGLCELNPITSTRSTPSLNRTDSKRRAVLPITCRKTSRMLTNTNLELNVDFTDMVPNCATGAKEPNLDSSRVPSCPNFEISSMSLNASKTSLDTYLRGMSLQNSTIREMPPNFDWKNIRASPSRFSASHSSSCLSKEDIWVLRKDT